MSGIGRGNKDAKLNHGPMHTNLNVIVAVDIRVGGNDPFNSDLLEVCFMPLNHSYRPHPEFGPFNLCIHPSFRVDLKIANLSKPRFETEFLGATQDGINAAELFGHWWTSIRARPDKKMQFLCWDWASKKPWLENWLDGLYLEIVDPVARDVMTLMEFLNDRNDYHGELPPFPIQTFSAMLNYSGTELLQRNSLMSNCKALSDVYRWFLHQR